MNCGKILTLDSPEAGESNGEITGAGTPESGLGGLPFHALDQVLRRYRSIEESELALVIDFACSIKQSRHGRAIE